MAGVDELFQAIRPAITGLRSVEVGPVVAPVARAGELGDGHELNGRDPHVVM